MSDEPTAGFEGYEMKKLLVSILGSMSCDWANGRHCNANDRLLCRGCNVALSANRLRKFLTYDGDALEPFDRLLAARNLYANTGSDAWRDSEDQALAESKARVAVIEARRKAESEKRMKYYSESAGMYREKTALIEDLEELISRKEFVSGVTQHMAANCATITVMELEEITDKHKRGDSVVKSH